MWCATRKLLASLRIRIRIRLRIRLCLCSTSASASASASVSIAAFSLTPASCVFWPGALGQHCCCYDKAKDDISCTSEPVTKPSQCCGDPAKDCKKGGEPSWAVDI